TAPLTPMCHGMVKTVAKRATGNTRAVDHGIQLSYERICLSPEGALLSSKYLTTENKLSLFEIEALKHKTQEKGPLEWVRALAQLNPRGDILHDFDRDIACLLLDGSGDLLGYGLNCNS